MFTQATNPIVAIATAPGRGGIGVVRISGPDLGPFILAFFSRSLIPRHAHYLNFLDAQQLPIDQGIALYFNQPYSYTGEDVLELQGHGGPAVLQQLLKRCLVVGQPFGLRLATPGEFTQRAFLNDKIDLAQAEAISDLIDATSEAAARAAVSSLSGEFSKRINHLSTSVVHLRILIEATLDFPEEEIEFLEKYQAKDKLDLMQSDLNTILAQSRQGMVLREGLSVVLAGEPNVGKSSLLNALAKEDLAIVTNIAGTTRDKVSQIIHLQGVPITIIDTAGLRETNDVIELIGIGRSWDEISKADVVIHLVDATQPFSLLDDAIETKRSRQSTVIQVFNKQDLLTNQSVFPNGSITISAKTGKGLDELEKKLLELAGFNPALESPWLARQRHIDALEQARMHLLIAQEYAKENDRVLDLFAEELRLAHDSLGSITGKMTADDLLGEIFSNFCIGK